MSSALDFPALFPLAALPEFPTIGESLTYQATGLTVVLLALCMIWASLELIGLHFKRVERRAKAARSAEPAATAGVPPEVIAVIAGVVHVMLGASRRIHSVKRAEPAVGGAGEGRRQITASRQG